MEIIKISEAQAREIILETLNFYGVTSNFSALDDLMERFRVSGYIEQSAEEKFEDAVEKLSVFRGSVQVQPCTWECNKALYYVQPVDKIIDLARAAIREAKGIR